MPELIATTFENLQHQMSCLQRKIGKPLDSQREIISACYNQLVEHLHEFIQQVLNNIRHRDSDMMVYCLACVQCLQDGGYCSNLLMDVPIGLSA